MRFLFYAVTAMTYLAYFLFLRLSVIWQNRNLPSVSTRTRLWSEVANWTVHGPFRCSACTPLRPMSC
jgi:hypothetical protein